MGLRHVLGLLVLAGCLGCDGYEASPLAKSPPGRATDDAADLAPVGGANRAPAAGPNERKKDAGGEAALNEPVVRKIIYTANVEVVVKDFDAAQEQLTQLIKSHKDAYVSKSDVRGTQGSIQTATWTIRVPVSEYEAFLDEVVNLGTLQQKRVDSQDVTDEYYDTKARVTNKQAEEQRLLKHLDQSTGRLDEILSVERELTRVRGEIERMQGRLQYLEKLSALTTVTVTLHSVKSYVPTNAPTFGASISQTFENSVDKLAMLGKGIVLTAVALGPWLPAIALVVLPLWWLVRRRRPVTVVAAEVPPPAR